MDTPPPSSPATGTGRSVAASTETATAAGPDAAETTVSSAVAEVLAAHTAHVFGIMGEGNAHFLDRAEAAGLPVTPTRHEAGAVSAADAYYRASSRLAVATTTYGAGFTNALTALTEATKSRIPLIYVTGGRGEASKPWDIDELAHLTSLGVFAFFAGDDAARVAWDAVTLAVAESRPVAIVIPEHLVAAPARAASDALLAPLEVERLAASESDLHEVVEALLGAERPLILGGRGLWDSGSGPEYRELANLLGADLATTAAARNLWGGHPRNLGGIGGFASDHIVERVQQADVVLSVGASLTPFTMRFGESFAPDATLIQVVLDSRQYHPRANLTLTADAARLVGELRRRIEEGINERGHETWAPFEGPSHWATSEFEPTFETVDRSPGPRVDPDVVARALNEHLPENRTVVSDGGHFLGWPATLWEVPDPAAFLQIGTAYKCIGIGTGAAAGAAYARPERTTVLVTGDGGLQMALADLVTFADAPGQRIVVVFNDAGYGAEGHQFEPRKLSLTMAELGDRDFAALGRALGGEGITVRDEEGVAQVSEWARANPEGFLVVDAKIRRGIAPFFEEIVQRSLKG